MDWKKIVSDLTAVGVTQVQIAERCGVAQATVSDLLLGKTASPGFAFGTALVQLHKLKCTARARKAAARHAG